jgi:hypothetical protein
MYFAIEQNGAVRLIHAHRIAVSCGAANSSSQAMRHNDYLPAPNWHRISALARAGDLHKFYDASVLYNHNPVWYGVS